jgi:hypothetical protein
MPERCPLGPAGRAWVEARLGWLLDAFPEVSPAEVEVSTPSGDLLRGYEPSPESAEALFERLRERLGLADVDLRFGIYEEDRGPDYSAFGQGPRQTSGTAGHYQRGAPGEPQYVRVNVEQLGDPLALTATLAHELGHELLIGQERITGDEPDQEPLTDLVTVFTGLGVFTANSAIRERNTFEAWSVGRLGYLRQEEFAYALALLARLRGEGRPAWAASLSTDVRVWMRECQTFLEARGWGKADAEAARAQSRNLDAVDFAALRAAAEDEEPGGQGESGCHRGLLLLIALPLLTVCLVPFLSPWLVAHRRELHVVNATPWPATVRVDAELVEVPPQQRVVLAPGEGSHQVQVTTPRGTDEFEIEMRTPWSKREQARQPVFVLNVLGAALLARQEVVYGSPALQAGSDYLARQQLYSGERLATVPDVDYPFGEPPTSVGSSAGATSRWQLVWIGQGLGPADVSELVTGQVLYSEQRAYLEHQRELYPDDQQLLDALNRLEESVRQPAGD